MIEEDYCPYEVAKLLKEKGFDEFSYYGWDKQLFDKEHPRNFSICFDNKEHWISCPTHQMAMKWLREVHSVFVNICAYWKGNKGNVISFYFGILQEGTPYVEKRPYSSYNEAVEAALKYSLENLI